MFTHKRIRVGKKYIEALKAPISSSTSYAKALGIYEGQPVEEALKLIA